MSSFSEFRVDDLKSFKKITLRKLCLERSLTVSTVREAMRKSLLSWHQRREKYLKEKNRSKKVYEKWIVEDFGFEVFECRGSVPDASKKLLLSLFEFENVICIVDDPSKRPKSFREPEKMVLKNGKSGVLRNVKITLRFENIPTKLHVLVSGNRRLLVLGNKKNRDLILRTIRLLDLPFQVFLYDDVVSKVRYNNRNRRINFVELWKVIEKYNSDENGKSMISISDSYAVFSEETTQRVRTLVKIGFYDAPNFFSEEKSQRRWCDSCQCFHDNENSENVPHKKVISSYSVFEEIVVSKGKEEGVPMPMPGLIETKDLKGKKKKDVFQDDEEGEEEGEDLWESGKRNRQNSKRSSPNAFEWNGKNDTGSDSCEWGGKNDAGSDTPFDIDFFDAAPRSEEKVESFDFGGYIGNDMFNFDSKPKSLFKNTSSSFTLGEKNSFDFGIDLTVDSKKDNQEEVKKEEIDTTIVEFNFDEKPADGNVPTKIQEKGDGSKPETDKKTEPVKKGVETGLDGVKGKKDSPSSTKLEANELVVKKEKTKFGEKEDKMEDEEKQSVLQLMEKEAVDDPRYQNLSYIAPTHEICGKATNFFVVQLRKHTPTNLKIIVTTERGKKSEFECHRILAYQSIFLTKQISEAVKLKKKQELEIIIKEIFFSDVEFQVILDCLYGINQSMINYFVHHTEGQTIEFLVKIQKLGMPKLEQYCSYCFHITADNILKLVLNASRTSKNLPFLMKRCKKFIAKRKFDPTIQCALEKMGKELILEIFVHLNSEEQKKGKKSNVRNYTPRKCVDALMFSFFENRVGLTFPVVLCYDRHDIESDLILQEYSTIYVMREFLYFSSLSREIVTNGERMISLSGVQKNTLYHFIELCFFGNVEFMEQRFEKNEFKKVVYTRELLENDIIDLLKFLDTYKFKDLLVRFKICVMSSFKSLRTLEALFSTGDGLDNRCLNFFQYPKFLMTLKKSTILKLIFKKVSDSDFSNRGVRIQTEKVAENPREKYVAPDWKNFSLFDCFFFRLREQEESLGAESIYKRLLPDGTTSVDPDELFVEARKIWAKKSSQEKQEYEKSREGFVNYMKRQDENFPRKHEKAKAKLTKSRKKKRSSSKKKKKKHCKRKRNAIRKRNKNHAERTRVEY